MSSLYVKGKTLYARYKDESGKWTCETTPFRPGQETLGLRRRRGHDLRRTFITLAQVDGARRDLLETVTHGPRGDIVSIYTTFPGRRSATRSRSSRSSCAKARFSTETSVLLLHPLLPSSEERGIVGEKL